MDTMNSLNDTQKFVNTSSPEEILEALNQRLSLQKISSHEYYIINRNDKSCVITNVPKTLYDKVELRKYEVPANIDRDANAVITLLKKNIKQYYRNTNEFDGFADGKPFQLNQCFHNSKGVYYIVNKIKNTMSLRNEPKIVLGYVVNKSPSGLVIDDKVIKSDSITLIDWHVWNYIENLLVDITGFSTDGKIKFANNFITWGKVEDHVFINPPDEMEYCGIDFSNFNKFSKEFDLHFKSEM
jgi:hypothetical protein